MAWIIPILVNFLLPFLIRFGLNKALDWLKKKYPWLPLPIYQQVADILEAHSKEQKDFKTMRRVARRKLREDLRERLQSVKRV